MCILGKIAFENVWKWKNMKYLQKKKKFSFFFDCLFETELIVASDGGGSAGQIQEELPESCVPIGQILARLSG